jgi:cell division protein FtsW (lipid II flippase)
MNIELSQKRTHRIRDYVLYFSISFAFVGIVVASALSHVDETKFMKWLFCCAETAFAFGFFIEKSRTFWRRNSFWLLTACFLTLHCIVIAAVLTRVKHAEGGWIAAGFLESIFLVNFSSWLLRPTPSPQ